MVKLTKSEIEELASYWNYNALPERYHVMEDVFDISEGDIVIDGGAYQGDMAMYFSKKVGKTGKVLSFEPSYSNIRYIQHIKRQMPYMSNVLVLQKALWDKVGSSDLYFSNYTNANSLLKNFRKVKSQLGSEQCRTTTIDKIVKDYKLKKIDFIWFNIEGAEVKALHGAKQSLLDFDVQLCISTHKVDDTYKTKDDVIKYLKSLGYKAGDVSKKHNDWVYARKV